jgi:hypothetical protein
MELLRSVVTHRVACSSAIMMLAIVAPLHAQQVTVTTPRHTVQDNFFERNGVGFGFNLRGSNPNGPGTRVVGLLPNGQIAPNGDIQFRQGGFDAAVPPAGGFANNPGAGAQGGFAIGGRGGEAFFNFAAGQGRTTSHTMEAPMVTVMNGMPGQFSDQIQTPFVTGVTPVVGGFGGGYGPPPLPSQRFSPLLERIGRLQAGERPAPSRAARRDPAAVNVKNTPLPAAAESTAGQAALSLAEIERRKAAGQNAADAEVLKLLDHGQRAEAAGKTGVARIFYRQAVSAATGPLRDQAQRKLHALSGSTSSATGP